MAEDSDLRTEDPTGKRLEEADSNGQVIYSAELTQSLLMVAGLLLISTCGPAIATAMKQSIRDAIINVGTVNLDLQTASSILTRTATRVLPTVAPVLCGLVILAFVVGILQVGSFKIRSEALEWKLTRLDPIAGFGRLFNFRAVVKMITSLAKLAVVGALAWNAGSSALEKLLTLGRAPVGVTMATALDISLGLMLRIGIALVIVGGLDFLYQKWQYIRDLRMTKQEIRDEMKSESSSVEVKRRRRQVALELSRARMMKAIPTATAVITNPTHYAVAIRYRRPGGLDPADDAPLVVAKGTELIAKRIREIATEAGIPIVENPPLARSLYRTTEIGSIVPPELYRGVAEVLAFVYRLKGQIRRN